MISDPQPLKNRNIRSPNESSCPPLCENVLTFVAHTSLNSPPSVRDLSSELLRYSRYVIENYTPHKSTTNPMAK